MPRPLAVLVLLALSVLGACSSDDENASPASTTASSANPVTTSTTTTASSAVDDPADLAGRIKAAGLGCGDFVEAPAEDRNAEVDRSGSCTLSSGKTLTIDVLHTRERWDHYVSLAGVGCSFFAGQEIPSVVGRWWAVFVDVGQDGKVDPVTTRQLSEPLEGEYETTSC